MEDELKFKKIYAAIFFGMLFVSICTLLFGCTLSFQNISTHGTATDLVDENQTASPEVTTTVKIPLQP